MSSFFNCIRICPAPVIAESGVNPGDRRRKLLGDARPGPAIARFRCRYPRFFVFGNRLPIPAKPSARFPRFGPGLRFKRVYGSPERPRRPRELKRLPSFCVWLKLWKMFILNVYCLTNNDARWSGCSFVARICAVLAL